MRVRGRVRVSMTPIALRKPSTYPPRNCRVPAWSEAPSFCMFAKPTPLEEV